MRTKGFTLIELLAVIVILAIIALIATPIILGIINNSKDESDQRSVENYADSVKNAIATYQVKENKEVEAGTYTTTDGKTLTNGETTLKVDYEGNVVCKTVQISEDGSVYLAKCKVNNGTKEYKYGKAGEKKETLAQYITNLYNNSTTKTNSLEVDGITYQLDTTNNLMNDRLGSATVGINEGNIRYYGANPNNYIDIGDRDSNGNVILWRIIGVFETKYATDSLPCNIDSDRDSHYDNCASEKLVKIIRNDSIGNIPWDTTDVNDWSTATLKTYLNTGTYYTSLNSDVTSKVENVLWNLGGYSTPEGVYANDFYGYERGITVYSGRPTEWVGKIGLMYPSDYGYAADLGQCNKDPYNYDTTTNCKGTDWLFNSSNQFTLSPYSGSPFSVFIVNSTGFVYNNYAYDTNIGVRPVLYLKSDISIVGTETTSEGLNYYVVE